MHRFNPEHHARLDDPERYKWEDPALLIEWLTLRGDETVIDVGSGTGFFALPLAKKLSGGSVIGVDVSPRMRDLLAAKAADQGQANITELATDGATIALSDAVADIVLIANVWHEITDAGVLGWELRRLIKPNGRLVIVDWKAEETPVGPPLAERIPQAEAIETIVFAGFRLVDQPDLYPYHYTAVFT